MTANDSRGRVFDAGLQPERTALAWQRTCLALTVAVLAASRGLLPLVGIGAYAIGAVGLVAVGWLAYRSERRYRRAHLALTATSNAPTLPSDGRIVLVATAIAFASGIAALAFVLTQVR